ncbi:MAG: SIS domain-containing protein [Candidatus Scalinduaceae bacterium]
MKNEIEKSLNESIRVKSELLSNSVEIISEIAAISINALSAGHSLYLIGNGGSAADAQHISGELVGRYKKDRKALPVIALTTDTSVLTAISNDYGYDLCFERQVEAFVKKGDVVFGLSTSGNSKNIINAIKLAKKIGAKTVGLTGREGGELKAFVDICLMVPSTDVPHIQECHITVGHILCSIIEKDLFGFVCEPG